MSGGTLTNQVIATATPTIYGWLAQWNTTTVPNGTYSLESVATDTVAETHHKFADHHHGEQSASEHHGADSDQRRHTR